MFNIKVLSFFQLAVSTSCPGFFGEPWVAFTKQLITSGDGDSQNGFSWHLINLKSGNPSSENFVVEMDMEGGYYNWILESLGKHTPQVFYSNIIGLSPTNRVWEAWSRLVKGGYNRFEASVREYLRTNFVIKWPKGCVGRFMYDALFNNWFVNLFSGTERRDVEDGYVPWPSSYPDRLTFQQFCRENGAICCFAFKGN